MVGRMERESQARRENRRFKQTGESQLLGIFQMWWHCYIAY